MKVLVLFSGGKDSTYAAWLYLSWGWEVELLTIKPEENSMMFHHPNTKWCPLQAKAMGVPHHFVKRKSDDELKDLQDAIMGLKRKHGIQGIVTGAIASEYQRQRIEIIGENVSLPTFNPLWHKDVQVLREMASAMEIRVVSVSAEGLGKEWLWRKIDNVAIAELEAKRPKLNVFFEGGEAETFVSGAIFFKKKIKIKKIRKKFGGTSGTAEIIRSSL